LASYTGLAAKQDWDPGGMLLPLLHNLASCFFLPWISKQVKMCPPVLHAQLLKKKNKPLTVIRAVLTVHNSGFQKIKEQLGS
jgi:hypothetical protein